MNTSKVMRRDGARLRPRPALLVALMLVIATLAHTAPAAPAAGVVQVRELANGMTVLVEERPGALATGVSLAVRAGTRDDDPERRGEIALLARALFGGTPTRPSLDSLAADVRATGGEIALNVDADLTGYTAVVPAGELDAAIDTLADMLLHPRFGVADLADALDDTLGGRYTGFDDDLAAALWPDHPAGMPGGGTAQTRAAITYDDLLALRERYFGAANLALSVVGPVRAEAVFARVQDAFGAVPAGERRPIVPAVAGPPGAERRERFTVRDQATVVMAFPTVGRDAPDAPAVAVLQLLLSGPDGRLFQDVRSGHGLARDVDTDSVTYADVGALIAIARVQPDNVDAAIDRFTDVFDGLRREPVPAAELQGLRDRVTGLSLLARQSPLSRASELATTAVLGRELSEDTALLDAIARMTPADVRAAAERYLAPDRAVTLIITPNPSRTPPR